MREYDDYDDFDGKSEYVNDILEENFQGLVSQLVEALYDEKDDSREMDLEEIVATMADLVGVKMPAHGMKWQLKPSRLLNMARFMMTEV